MRERHRAELGRFRPDIRENFFTERVVKHWHRLLRGVVDAPCLPAFKRHLDSALNSVLLGFVASTALPAEDPQVWTLFQPRRERIV